MSKKFWFGEECETLKNSLRRKSRKLRKNPNLEGLHRRQQGSKKTLKKEEGG